jgi:hypothetical protein
MANDKLVPTTTDLSSIRSNWGIYRRSGLYALAITPSEAIASSQISSQLGGALAALGITNTGSTFPGSSSSSQAIEFVFNVNPKNITTDEPPAVNIVPTQDGSQFVENQGNIYKNITISGTTGLRPNPKLSQEIIPIVNVPNPFSFPSVDPDTGLPAGEVTGFDGFIKLRNLFRAYYDIKRDPKKAHKFVMVWQNGKEGEWFIVEPTQFRITRDSSSPLTARYEIGLRSIKRYDLGKSFKDSRRKLNPIAALNKKLVDFTAKLSRSLAQINAVGDRVVGITQATISNTGRALGAIEAVPGTFQGIVSAATDLYNALTNVSSLASRTFAIPQNTVSELAKTATGAFEAIQGDLRDKGNFNDVGASQAFAAFNSFKQIMRISASVAAEDSLYGDQTEQKVDRRRNAYTTIDGPPRTGGDPTNLNNVRLPSSTRTEVVTGFDTIFTMAQRYLGDQGRWKELVLLNDLKAPYIDAAGDGIKVLRPGDQILVPGTSSDLDTGVVQDRSSTRDHLVRRMGRDIKLAKPDAAGGFTGLDFTVNARGDLTTIEGVPNLAQAIEIKFSTEQGTLPTHPTFGLQVPIGSKANIRSLIGFQMQARATLLADSRIESVDRLDFRIVGNTVTVSALLQIAGVNEALGVSFDSRR